MRSGLLFVLVVTCISAQLYTTNADVQKTNESTRSLPKPPSQLLKKVREQIQAREGEEECIDTELEETCRMYKDYGYCNYNWGSKSCRNTCGKCGTITVTLTGCSNIWSDSDCERWGPSQTLNVCQTSYCKKWCGLCN